ncbi:ABC transporter permease [Flavitalea sp.]|nr:ABC transporter permease [Flavitalea sp.]
MLSQFLKSAFRSIRKNKTYSFLNIFGLGIGIACAGLIFLWVEDELNYNKNNAKAEKLYELKVNLKLAGNLFTIYSSPRPMAAAMKTEIPGIADAARYSDNAQRLLVNTSDKSLYSLGRYTDPSLFRMFSFHFLKGNASNPFPQLYSMVITGSCAKKLFGNEGNVVGKVVRIDNKQDYVISAVVEDLPENSTLQFEWLAPYEIITNELKNTKSISDAVDWGSYGPITYVELENSINVEDVNSLLKGFIKQKASDQKAEAFLFPMAKWRLYNEFANGQETGGGRIKQVNMFVTIAWIILLIACINFMNLATASSQKRAREVGVRKVLGSGRKKLILQFMGEALMMSFFAMLFALIIITVTLPFFNLLMEKTLQPDFGNPNHILAMMVITLVCGITAGIYPSVFLSSFNPTKVLKGLRGKNSSAVYIRKGLVVTQFVVSVVFIISTVIVYNQILHVKNRKLGFNRENLIEINPQQDVSKTFPIIRDQLIQTGIIQDVALADHSTLVGGNTDSRFKWQGKPGGESTTIAHRHVSPQFIAVSGMRIMHGRDFINNPVAENSNVIINQSMEKLMGSGTAVGQIIQSPRGNDNGVFSDMTVIGVVEDYVYGNIFGKADPLIIFCKPPQNQNFLYLRLKDNIETESSLAKIEAVMKKLNPAYPLEYKFVDEQFNQLFKTETLLSKISGIFAGLAIVISALGLFGLAAYTAERRTKEIGIRKVLGATVAGVTVLLSKEFLQLVIISCLVAFPLAWLIMDNWLQSYEYRAIISWWVFGAAGLTAILIAVTTISFHSIKAALANPVKSLKTE